MKHDYWWYVIKLNNIWNRCQKDRFKARKYNRYLKLVNTVLYKFGLEYQTLQVDMHIELNCR